MFSKEFLRLKPRSILVEIHSSTMKKIGVPFLLGILLVLFGVQGTPIIRNRRCSCISTSPGNISFKFLKDLQQFAPSLSCENTEIIATKKNGEQTCLNPDSPDVKKLVQEWEKKVSQKKNQKKGKKHQKTKKSLKVKKSKHPRQKKTT